MIDIMKQGLGLRTPQQESCPKGLEIFNYLQCYNLTLRTQKGVSLWNKSPCVQMTNRLSEKL